MSTHSLQPSKPRHEPNDEVPWWRLALLLWVALGLVVWLSSCQKKSSSPTTERSGAGAMAGPAPMGRPAVPAMRRAPAEPSMGTRPAARRTEPASRRAADPRPAPARPGGAALAPLPREVDLGPELKRLYGMLVCEGRKPDGPCQKMAAAIERYRKGYLAPMRKWLAAHRPKDLPATLLYPFAGGDLVSALSAFPQQRRFVHISLEHAGPVDPLRGRKAHQVHAARWALHWMAGLLLSHGESFSVDLQKQEQAGLPGVLPMFLVGLRVHGAQPTGLAYLKVTPEGKLVPYTRKELMTGGPKARRRYTTWKDPRFSARFSHMELRFRLPGDTTDRRVIHLSVNLGNPGLRRVPGVVKFLSGLGPVALMIKASSYLMWTEDFSRIRDLIFAHTRFALSDLTAPYPRWLRKRGFRVEAYGKYACMKKAKLRGAAVPWIQLFRKPTTPHIPFRYGYVDCRGQNHLVLIRK